MIEDYLSESRRLKPTTEEIVEHYNEYYKILTLQLPFELSKPNFTAVYSADRRCELVGFRDDEQYLVYDQCLGQSFNHLNRIQFASHSKGQLSRAYASKYIAEKLLLKGEYKIAAVLSLLSVGFENNIDGDKSPFLDVPENKEYRRLNYIVVQELFVIAHELGHLFLNNAKTSEIEQNIKNQIEIFIERKDARKGERYDLIAERYGEKLAQESNQHSSAEYYGEIFSKQPELLAELFSDQFGMSIAFRAATEIYDIDPVIVAEGLILGFKYLRLFNSLDALAEKLSAINYGDKKLDSSNTKKELEECVWKGKHGNLRSSQLREHFLRSQVAEICCSIGSNEILNTLPDVVDEYDVNTEFPVLLDLVDTLSEEKAVQLVGQMIKPEAELKEIVDNITGWS